jgi:hypothetical protein
MKSQEVERLQELSRVILPNQRHITAIYMVKQKALLLKMMMRKVVLLLQTKLVMRVMKTFKFNRRKNLLVAEDRQRVVLLQQRDDD